MITFGKQKEGYDSIAVFYDKKSIGFQGLKPTDKIALQRCPKCNLENYSSCVTSGICYSYGFDVNVEHKLEKIAKDHLTLDDLQTRNVGSLDFKEQAVWNIRGALIAAFEAGKLSNESRTNKKNKATKKSKKTI